MKNEVLFSSVVSPTTFIEEKNSENGHVYFIKGYIKDTCVGIYDKNMYPLIIAKLDESLEIVTINSHSQNKYILRKCGEKILGIYSDNGKSVFESNENQEINIVFSDNDSFIINILEKNKPTILYNVLSKKEILRATYLNTTFSIDDNNYLEYQNVKLKAVYDKYTKSLMIKSALGSIELIQEPYTIIYIYAKELNAISECHKIYKLNSLTDEYKELYSNDNFDLTLEYINQKDIAIFGKVNNLYKFVIFYKSSTDRFIYSKTLDLDSEEYYKPLKYISHFETLPIMFKDKCVKILNSKLDKSLAVDYDKNSNITHYFEFHNNFIKEIKDGCCIAYYDLNGNLFINTNTPNETIEICKNSTIGPTFFVLKNNKCLMVQNENYCLDKKEDVTYNSWTPYNENFIGGYIVKNGKNIGIFDFNLRTIICFDYDTNFTIEAIKYGIYEETDQDRLGFPCKVDVLKLIYLVYTQKYYKVYNEKNELLLQVDKDNLFRLYQNKYLLLGGNGNFCSKVYSVEDCKIDIPLATNSKDQLILPYESKSGIVFFEIVDFKSKKHTALFVKNGNIFSNIIDDYERLIDFYDFILVINNDNKFTVIKIPDFGNNFNTYELCDIKELIILHIEDTTFPYIYNKNSNKHIYSIYEITKNGFERIITSSSDIEVVYIDNNMFFKTNGKIYNKVGNII